MKQIVISLVAVVFLTVPVLAGEIDGSGKQPPPPPPPPTSDATTSDSPTETVILEVFLLLTSILP